MISIFTQMNIIEKPPGKLDCLKSIYSYWPRSLRYHFKICPYGLMISIILVCFLTACLNQAGTSPLEVAELYQVDNIFRDFYQKLGGREVIGPAISPLFTQDKIVYQYTTACLLMYDPQNQKYSLAPLGFDMGIVEKPLPGDWSNRGHYVGGHYIYPLFQSIFEKMGGIDSVGAPLTEVRHNENMHRFEQYFENLGFFIIDGRTDQRVGLLAYGTWKCDLRCSYLPSLNSRVDISKKKAAPFVKFVTDLETNFTGFALSEPYIATDGNLEQVYENMILFVDPEHPDQVALRPLPDLLAMKSDPLETASHDPNNFFYPVEAEEGYNIPIQFMEYLKSKGGIKYIGPPITRCRQSQSGLLQQCFATLCLEEKRDPYGKIEVAPLPLGYAYRAKFQLTAANPLPETDQSEIHIQLWEQYPMISSDQSQIISASVFIGNNPLPNVEPELVVFLPEKKARVYFMPATGKNGETRLSLDKIDVKSGTLIPYQVCIISSNQLKFCVKDSFLIW